MPSYLNNGIEQMKAAEHVVEALPEPNRQYAKDFESYMQVLNHKPRTIGCRMLELRMASGALRQRRKASYKEGYRKPYSADKQQQLCTNKQRQVKTNA